MAQKLENFQYTRPDFDTYKLTFIMAIKKFKKTESINQAQIELQNIENLIGELLSSYEILKIISLRKESDFPYQEELTIWQENQPLFDELINRFSNSFLKSKFKNQLILITPKTKFNLANNFINTYSEENTLLKIQEQKLIKDYSKIINSKIITINDEFYNLSFILNNFFKFSKNNQIIIKNEMHSFLQQNSNTLLELHKKIFDNRKLQTTNLNYTNYLEYILTANNRLEYELASINNLSSTIINTLHQDYSLNNYPVENDYVFPNKIEELDNLLSQLFIELGDIDKSFFLEISKHVDTINDSKMSNSSWSNFIVNKQISHLTINLTNLQNNPIQFLNTLGQHFQSHTIKFLKTKHLLFSLPLARTTVSKSFEIICWPVLLKLLTKDTTNIHFELFVKNNINDLVSNAKKINFINEIYTNPNFDIKNSTVMDTLNYNYTQEKTTDMLWLLDFDLVTNFGAIFDNLVSSLIGLQFLTKDYSSSEKFTNFLNITKNSCNLPFDELITSNNLLSPMNSELLNTIFEPLNKTNMIKE